MLTEQLPSSSPPMSQTLPVSTGIYFQPSRFLSICSRNPLAILCPDGSLQLKGTGSWRLFLACFSAACWNLEAGWASHRQGSVALQKPFNPSPQFFSMPSLSSNKFVLNLLTASAFQWHALYNLFPTKLQKANKRAKERGLNATTDSQSLSFTTYKADAVLTSRCRRKR